MRKVAIVALLALLSAGAMFSFSHFAQKRRAANDSTIDLAFNTWLNTQNKIYSSPAEKAYRRTVFAANYQKIQQNNQIYSYVSAVNKFTDMTEEEFIAKYTGLNYDPAAPKNYANLDHVTINQSGKDWRADGKVNKVKDQRACGSCWAFSATSAIESAWAIKNQELLDLSEQQLVDCGRKTGNQGCNGGWMDYAFKYIQQAGGQDLTSDYPYTARDGTCRDSSFKPRVKITGFTDVPKNDCATLLKAINQQPVSVAVAANAMMSYSKGIFDNPNCGTGLNHGVTAVGFGTEGGKNFYIVRNSWGANWGEDGYIRMSRDVQTSTGICGICMVSSYPQSA